LSKQLIDRLYIPCVLRVKVQCGKAESTKTQSETQTKFKCYTLYRGPGRGEHNGVRNFHFISRVIWGGAASNCCNVVAIDIVFVVVVVGPLIEIA